MINWRIGIAASLLFVTACYDLDLPRRNTDSGTAFESDSEAKAVNDITGAPVNRQEGVSDRADSGGGTTVAGTSDTNGDADQNGNAGSGSGAEVGDTSDAGQNGNADSGGENDSSGTGGGGDTDETDGIDECPDDPKKSTAGLCGCGVTEDIGDDDRDDIINCLDTCPRDECSEESTIDCNQGQLSTCTTDANGCFTLESRTCPTGACLTDTQCGVVTKGEAGSFTGGDWNEAEYLEMDGDGNVFVAGTTNSTSMNGVANVSGGNFDAFLVKWSSSGTLLWTKRHGTTEGDTYGWGLAVDTDGRVALTGHEDNRSDLIAVLWPANATAGSSPLWTYRSPLSARSAAAREAVFVPGGDLFIVGDTGDALPGYQNAGDSDAILVRLNASTGALVWGRQWGGSEANIAYDVATDGESLYVAEQTYTDPYVPNYIVWKRDIMDGSAIWECPLGTTQGGYPRIAMGSGGVVVVLVGNIIKWINKENGTVFIEKDSKVGYEALGVDGAGAVYAGSFDDVVYKYNPDGTLAWEAALNVPLRALAVTEATGGSFRMAASDGSTSVAFLTPEM